MNSRTFTGLKVGGTVRIFVGLEKRGNIGIFVGLEVGGNVGSFVGLDVGGAVGNFVGLDVGGTVGNFVGLELGGFVGIRDGLVVLGFDVIGIRVGLTVGEAVIISQDRWCRAPERKGTTTSYWESAPNHSPPSKSAPPGEGGDGLSGIWQPFR